MPEQFNMGVDETADPSQIVPGGMQVARGIFYKPGDDRAWLLRPGTSMTASHSTPNRGLVYAPFDNGPDALILRVGSASGTLAAGSADGSVGIHFGEIEPNIFASLNGDRMVSAHYNDKVYLALGSDQSPYALRSTGAFPLVSRLMGLRAPQTKPTLTAQMAGATARPTATVSSTGWVNPSNAWDSSLDTFASGTLTGPGSITLELGTWEADTGSARKLMCDWALAAIQETDIEKFGDDVGAKLGTGTVVTVSLQFKDQNDTTFTEFGGGTFSDSQPKKTAQVQWGPDGQSTATFAAFRAVFTYVRGSGPITLRIHDVRIQRGGSAAAFSGTFIYFVSEWIKGEDIKGTRSDSAEITTVSGSGHNAVLITLPAQQNAAATHRLIYRTVNGGTLNTAGRIGECLIGETTYLDDFVAWPPTTPPGETYPLMAVGSLFYERDSAPPALNYIWSHQGRLMGIESSNPRSLRYSHQGVPESWPEIYNVPSIPLPEHDKLLAGAELTGFSVVATTGGMLRLLDVPSIKDGRLSEGQVQRIEGAPGCVGYLGFCTVPWRGESSVAWVSPDMGICITNGHTWDFVSNVIDWSKFANMNMSAFTLHFDRGRRCLIFGYRLSGVSYHYLGFIERGHPRGGIQWTGPHTATSDFLGVFDYVASGNLSTGGYRLWSASGTAFETIDVLGTPTDIYHIIRQDDPTSVVAVPFLLTARRAYGPNWSAVSMLDGRLRHNDWGASATLSLAWTIGRDASGSGFTDTKTVSVALNGNRGTQFDISRSGEWHEFSLSGSPTAGAKALIELDAEVYALGREGKVSAA